MKQSVHGLKKNMVNLWSLLETCSIRKPNEEDFEQEDDLMDWEFAKAALNWWQSRISELRHDS